MFTAGSFGQLKEMGLKKAWVWDAGWGGTGWGKAYVISVACLYMCAVLTVTSGMVYFNAAKSELMKERKVGRSD